MSVIQLLPDLYESLTNELGHRIGRETEPFRNKLILFQIQFGSDLRNLKDSLITRFACMNPRTMVRQYTWLRLFFLNAVQILSEELTP